MDELVDFDVAVNRVKRLCEDGTRSSSQSRKDQVVRSRKSSTISRRSRSHDRRRSCDRVRSTPDKSIKSSSSLRPSVRSTPDKSIKSSFSVRPSRPYAAGLAAQLSQKRKQLEARAKEKSKLEKENLAKLSADSKVELYASSPSLRKTNERKVIIEIHDDDEQHVSHCQKTSSVDLSNGLPPVLEEKVDDASSKTDDVSTITTDNTPASSSDTSSTQSDDVKHEAMQTSDSRQTGMDCSATKSAPAVLSLMNLPMPPVASESDSEVTPASSDA